MMPVPAQLANKCCLIVGGTSGIGLAAARRFLEEGARVAAAGLADPAGAEAVASLSALGPVRYFPCDASDPGQVVRLFAEATAYLEGLDVLFHVAGASGRRHGDGPLHECTDEGWRATLDANLKCTFLTNRAAINHFLGRKQGGAILNTASVLALSPSPRHFDACAYTAAKGGIIAMSRLAAARYAADFIRVNVLAPGLIETPMAQRAARDELTRAYLRTKQPLAAGPGLPDDCAGAAAYLCSDAARLVTGVVLPVDGGWCVSEGQYE
jgi:NAD(P)-dependent dehydrogenase (short-subunit alcohol dehydrogenase family)